MAPNRNTLKTYKGPKNNSSEIYNLNASQPIKKRRKKKLIINELPPRIQACLVNESLQVNKNSTLDPFDRLKDEVIKPVRLLSLSKIGKYDSTDSDIHTSNSTGKIFSKKSVYSPIRTRAAARTNKTKTKTQEIPIKEKFKSNSYIKPPKKFNKNATNTTNSLKAPKPPYFRQTHHEKTTLFSSTPLVVASAAQKLVAGHISPITKANYSKKPPESTSSTPKIKSAPSKPKTLALGLNSDLFGVETLEDDPKLSCEAFEQLESREFSGFTTKGIQDSASTSYTSILCSSRPNTVENDPKLIDMPFVLLETFSPCREELKSFAFALEAHKTNYITNRRKATKNKRSELSSNSSLKTSVNGLEKEISSDSLNDKENRYSGSSSRKGQSLVGNTAKSETDLESNELMTQLREISGEQNIGNRMILNNKERLTIRKNLEASDLCSSENTDLPEISAINLCNDSRFMDFQPKNEEIIDNSININESANNDQSSRRRPVSPDLFSSDTSENGSNLSSSSRKTQALEDSCTQNSKLDDTRPNSIRNDSKFNAKPVVILEKMNFTQKSANCISQTDILDDLGVPTVKKDPKLSGTPFVLLQPLSSSKNKLKLIESDVESSKQVSQLIVSRKSFRNNISKRQKPSLSNKQTKLSLANLEEFEQEIDDDSFKVEKHFSSSSSDSLRSNFMSNSANCISQTNLFDDLGVRTVENDPKLAGTPFVLLEPLSSSKNKLKFIDSDVESSKQESELIVSRKSFRNNISKRLKPSFFNNKQLKLSLANSILEEFDQEIDDDSFKIEKHFSSSSSDSLRSYFVSNSSRTSLLLSENSEIDLVESVAQLNEISCEENIENKVSFNGSLTTLKHLETIDLCLTESDESINSHEISEISTINLCGKEEINVISLNESAVNDQSETVNKTVLMPISEENECSIIEEKEKTFVSPVLTRRRAKIEQQGKRLTLKTGKSYRRSLAIIRRSSFLQSQSCRPDCLCPKCSVPVESSFIERARRQSQIVPLKPFPRVSILEIYAEHRSQIEETSYVLPKSNYTKSSLDDSLRILSLNCTEKTPASLHTSTLIKPSNLVVVTAKEIVLRRCRQTEPLPFEECYPESVLKNCQKIGEGVYGEVFLCKNPKGGTSVLKVIPIEGDQIVNGETQKKFDQILSEIVIAMELSNLRGGVTNSTDSFNEVQSVRCVQGRYPDRLIELWDLYAETRGTENDSPEMFNEAQLFIVLELDNGGTDLEAYIFKNAMQAFAMFQQTACALAVAECQLKFEHRDLHWGNILIKPVADATKSIAYSIDGRKCTVPCQGIQISVIDFTLSRIEFDGVIIFEDLSNDNDLFQGEGDYQFEMYRLMQSNNRNDWKVFKPYSNILWLHYILDKAVTSALRYKNRASKTHRNFLAKLLEYKEEILSFDSVTEFVKDRFEF